MAQPHAQPQPLSVAHGDDSSPAMRLARARIADRFERYVSLQDPQLSSAWHSSAVQRYAPSFLQFLVTHDTRNDGQPVKAQTLIRWLNILVQCILARAWDGTNGERAGSTLLVQQKLYTTLTDQVSVLIRTFGLKRT